MMLQALTNNTDVELTHFKLSLSLLRVHRHTTTNTQLVANADFSHAARDHMKFALLLHSYTELFCCFTVDTGDRLFYFLLLLAYSWVQWGLCVHYYDMSAGAFPADVYLCFLTSFSSSKGEKERKKETKSQKDRQGKSERCGHKRLD